MRYYCQAFFSSDSVEYTHMICADSNGKVDIIKYEVGSVLSRINATSEFAARYMLSCKDMSYKFCNLLVNGVVIGDIYIRYKYGFDDYDFSMVVRGVEYLCGFLPTSWNGSEFDISLESFGVVQMLIEDKSLFLRLMSCFFVNYDNMSYNLRDLIV